MLPAVQRPHAVEGPHKWQAAQEEEAACEVGVPLVWHPLAPRRLRLCSSSLRGESFAPGASCLDSGAGGGVAPAAEAALRVAPAAEAALPEVPVAAQAALPDVPTDILAAQAAMRWSNLSEARSSGRIAEQRRCQTCTANGLISLEGLMHAIGTSRFAFIALFITTLCTVKNRTYRQAW